MDNQIWNTASFANMFKSQARQFSTVLIVVWLGLVKKQVSQFYLDRIQ